MIVDGASKHLEESAGGPVSCMALACLLPASQVAFA